MSMCLCMCTDSPKKIIALTIHGDRITLCTLAKKLRSILQLCIVFRIKMTNVKFSFKADTKKNEKADKFIATAIVAVATEFIINNIYFKLEMFSSLRKKKKRTQ